MGKEIPEIKNLNRICNKKRYGIYKQWIYKKGNYMKMCDYMQKINYSIQDLNSTINVLTIFERKNIIFIISLVDWIREAFNAITKVIDTKYIKDFNYSKQHDLRKHCDYF